MSAAATTLLLLLARQAFAQQNPGQPTKSGRPGTFEIVGHSGVSAQQLFLGTTNKVYIVDKTENNTAQINGHAAWATEYDLTTNEYRVMDVRTNSFCAGGSPMGDGTWLNVGGNEAIFAGGDPIPNGGSGGPYQTVDGRRAVRTLEPCDDSSCEWSDDPSRYMSGERWYPTLETLEEGNVIIIGGHQRGGFVNDATFNRPSYEFFPANGSPIELDLLKDTLPANLYPLTWLLPSGRLFIQLNYGTYIMDYKNADQRETRLPDMPYAVRTYPASAGTVMLPLTPENDYKATVLFCGGTDLQPTEWNVDVNLAQHPADASCVKMTPDDPNPQWVDDDSLPEGRVMGSAILLPTGQVVLLNGANTGVAGYGTTQSWTVGPYSYADHPITKPLIYSPDKPAGQRWSDEGFEDSTVFRMYHSAATLLPDGSIFVSGSNPNPDYVAPGPLYPTEFAVERFYPAYYDKRRPEPRSLPESLSYGGPYFNVTLSKEDLEGNLQHVRSAKAVVIRTGFSTHAINMGQRMLQLETSYTAKSDGSAVLHVSQMPPNPALFAPGPALMFIVVNGVPSVGVQVMIGNGKVGPQPTRDNVALPQSFMVAGVPDGDGSGSNNGALGLGVSSGVVLAMFLAVCSFLW